APAMVIDDALRRHYLVEGDAVLVVAAVRTVHDEAPDAARPELEARRGGGEAVGSPPLRQMFRLGPRRKHQLARLVVFAHPDDGARVAMQVQTICGGHVSCPHAYAAWLAAFADNRRGGRNSARRSGGSARASRRCPSALPARSRPAVAAPPA